MRGRPDDLLRAQRPVLSLLLGDDKADGGGHHGSPVHARWLVTIPEVRRYRSYEEPDETPNRGARFGS